MKRAQKQDRAMANRLHLAQAKFTSRSRENTFAMDIDESPAMVAQRQRLDRLFGGAIQRVEDEEPLQGKFAVAQTKHSLGEEEFLPGRFGTAQRVEEEEPLQGKLETASSVQRKEAAKPNNTQGTDMTSVSGASLCSHCDNTETQVAGMKPVQRVTAIHCADQYPSGNTMVWNLNHGRDSVHNTARQDALALGEWSKVQSGAVCNHHMSYDTILGNVIGAMGLPDTLSGIAATVDHMQGMLGFTPPSPHINRVIAWQVNPTVTCSWDEANGTLNYYIYKICDYANNLFFWPSKTGGDPDFPTNAYLQSGGLPGGWAPKNSLKSDQQRLNDETARIKAGAQDIMAAIP